MLALPEYRIGPVLGEGGSGTVYAATRLADDRAVAIKVLRADLALTPSEAKRFLDEAALLERLSHAGVVPIFASGRLDDGRPYLVMQRLDGETLSARLARGPLPAAEALAVFDELADAVIALHDAGVVHRDLKPDNIVLGKRVVLVDFGIAKDVDAAPSTTTRDGRVRGTPAYMAPERFFHAAASERTDVYELAVTLYEMLVGALPWSDVEDVAARLDPAPRDLPPGLWSVLRSALASNATQRPQSVRAFREAVRAADASEVVSPRTQTIERRVAKPADTAPDASDDRPSQRGIAVAIGAAVVASAGAIGFAVMPKGADEASPPAVAPAPPVRFCGAQTPPPLFCADFERPDFRAGFVNNGKTPDPGEQGGGTIQHRDGRAIVRTPPLVAATNKANATLIAELATPIRYAVITFRMRIATELFADDKAVAMIFSLDFGAAGAINFSRRQSGTQLVVYQGKTPEKTPLPPIAVGAWKTFKLIVHNYASGSDGRGDVAVFIDGLAAKVPLPAELQTDTAPRLAIGIVAARGPAEALEIEVDDIAVTQYDGPE